MDNDKFVFVEFLNNIKNVVKQTFRCMQRIKILCIDVSDNFILFGATSGGIYIFKRDPCEFLKLIPSKEGDAKLIAISPDERHIGIATSKGLILILENFIEDPNVQYQVFSEHEGNLVTCIKWHRNELYIGDEFGKVSVVSATSALFPTKSIFQIPSASLMTLDSYIVQIEACQCYLLISTKTKTYLCNTEKEHFIQIGKKLRDGYFGACFCNIPIDTGTANINQNIRNQFRTIKENEVIIAGEEVCNTKIYCARPGARLWVAGFDAQVQITYQFRTSLKVKPKDLLIIGSEEESILQKKSFTEKDIVPENFHFHKVFPVCDRFILTYDTNHLYIFDPSQSSLLFYAVLSNNITDIAFSNNTFYVWGSNLELNIFSVVGLEHLILATLYKKQYYLCAGLCVEYYDDIMEILEKSKKLYLISILKTKISSEMLDKIAPLIEKINETNEKVLKRQVKNNIVVVENLYMQNEKEMNIYPEKNVEEENRDMKLILKQYRLHKTHRNVEIPEVMQFLQTLDGENCFMLFIHFIDYVAKELEEDATLWSREQYLKQISRRNIIVKDLQNESFNFLSEAVYDANKNVNFSCTCGYPLPQCHQFPPNYYKTALDIFYTKRNFPKLMENVPYLWRYLMKTEIDGLNLTLILQFSDLILIKEHLMEFKYDNWHDVLGYFVKINKGLCLKCDRKIDIDGLLTWTDLAKVIVQSMGASNTLKILEKYVKFIPNGALDPTFYQSCIFAHSFTNDNGIVIVKSEEPFKFIGELDRGAYNQFQESLEKYFNKKYINVRTPSYTIPVDNAGICSLCNLPLKNEILFDCEHLKNCGHRFHKFCLKRNNNQCGVCT